MRISRLSAGLVAVATLLMSALGTSAYASQSAPATPLTQTAATTAADPMPTGDPRDVTEPTLPAVTCATLTAALPGGTEQFDAADEAAPPDTARIQAALNACSGSGGSVLLTGDGNGNTSFLSGPLTVKAGEYLVVDSGVTLFATLDATAYQQTGSGKAPCGSIGTNSNGCNAFITVTGGNNGVEGVVAHDSTGIHWGTIDGRGDMDVLGTSSTWWQNAATATAEGLKQVNPRLIQTNSDNNLTVYDIRLVNSAKQHLFISKSTGATVWGIQIDTPDNTYNTDGVDVDSSTDVTVEASNLMEGDDCVALTTNSAAESDITVRKLNCYGTHGLSIGSGTEYGLNNILFADNTINGYDSSGNPSTLGNGIRIKSYAGNGGTVSDVEYFDTCMTGLQYPIVINPFYDPATGTTHIPDFQSITIDRALSVNSQPGAYSTIDGYNADYPTGLALTDVNLDATTITAQYANVALTRTNLAPAGTGVTDTTAPGNPDPTPVNCTFPPFPGG